MGGGSYRLLRVFGIDILVHWSWFGIFALLTWWLAQGFFKDEYDWTAGQRWAAAVVAALTFFTSILLHELAHSLMARREGLPVNSITLFIFGGVSALGGEPSTPGQEFRVAIVGPVVSFVLAAVFGAAAANAAASTKLTSGPTMATRNSCPGVDGSPPRADTPPKMNSVMLVTGSPSRFATSEWASSCKRIELKKMSAATTADAHRCPAVQSPYSSWKKPVASHQVRRAKIPNQLQWTRMSMPKTRRRR